MRPQVFSRVEKIQTSDCYLGNRSDKMELVAENNLMHTVIGKTKYRCVAAETQQTEVCQYYNYEPDNSYCCFCGSKKSGECFTVPILLTYKRVN